MVGEVSANSRPPIVTTPTALRFVSNAIVAEVGSGRQTNGPWTTQVSTRNGPVPVKEIFPS